MLVPLLFLKNNEQSCGSENGRREKNINNEATCNDRHRDLSSSSSASSFVIAIDPAVFARGFCSLIDALLASIEAHHRVYSCSADCMRMRSMELTALLFLVVVSAAFQWRTLHGFSTVHGQRLTLSITRPFSLLPARAHHSSSNNRTIRRRRRTAIRGRSIESHLLVMMQNEESGVEGQCVKEDKDVFDGVVSDRNAVDVDSRDESSATATGAEKSPEQPKVKASKKEMLGFAVPALGIYLTNPLLSNIDNAFVGRTVGTAGLAALSPATICTDQMLYLFSFLSRATTSIVARAYALRSNNHDYSGGGGNDKAAREAASAPLTVSLLCGAGLSLFYAFGTPFLLGALRVDPALRPAAASYIYWRGSIAWAALAQAACLSTMMATRDAVTPLKIIGLAAVVNVVGDYMLCAWPLRLGCAGAAAATSLATLLSCGFMLKGLQKKHILPRIKVPSKKNFKELMDFTGPLLLITITRLGGFIAMQRTAMKLGVQVSPDPVWCARVLLEN